MNYEDSFFHSITRSDEKPFNETAFFKDAIFARAIDFRHTKLANPMTNPMDTSAKQQGWEVPQLKAPTAPALSDVKPQANGLDMAKPNMMTQAMGSTSKMVQQQPNNPTGVSNGQGFNPV